MSIRLSDCAMTFASHVVTTAILECHILTKICITIYSSILTWYKHFRIFKFNCISMKNIFRREVSCVFCRTCQWRLRHVHMEFSPVLYNPCKLRAWNRRMRSNVHNGVYHFKISPTPFDPCNISIIAYFRPKLYCHSFVAKTEIATGIFI